MGISPAAGGGRRQRPGFTGGGEIGEKAPGRAPSHPSRSTKRPGEEYSSIAEDLRGNWSGRRVIRCIDSTEPGVGAGAEELFSKKFEGTPKWRGVSCPVPVPCVATGER